MERVILASLVFILLMGCTSQSASTQSAIGAPSASASAAQPSAAIPGSQASASGPKTYTLDEVSQHNAASNCWVILNGKVYDITAYIASGMHNKPLDGFCGTDATSAFETRGGMGAHPPKAANVMSNLYIGDVAK